MSPASFRVRPMAMLTVALWCWPAMGQPRVRPAGRIRGAIERRAVAIRGAEPHPLARPEFDDGPAAADLRMERMVLALAPDPDQQRALEELVAAQHDPESPLYQRWLTPEEFGLQFGVSDSDIDQITAWLRDWGFEVEPVGPDRRAIVFSGTAAQVAEAFRTEIRQYRVGGERYFGNAAPARVPEAMAEVVQGVFSLNSFPLHALHAPVGRGAGGIEPLWSTSGGGHYVAPGDFAKIYDAASLHASGIDGTGQSIAIVGRTNLNVADVQKFRSTLGLPARDPEIIVNGTDPGIVSSDELGEAVLDVEWAGAAAPRAAVKLVVSKSTAASDGVVLSAQYAVSRNVAPIVSVSFGACEADMGASGNQFWNSLWQQAAAQGMTVVVASGDSGAAGCDAPTASTAKSSKSVNGLCSSPYATCVGGTQFEAVEPSQYWSAANGAGNTSAVGYIPEAAWNESAEAAGGTGLWSTGGGVSTVYQKPSWQTGSAMANRAVPDVSLNGSSGTPYVIYMNGQYYLMAGTSASAPALAGLLALAAQRTGGRLGNANPALYGFAARQAAGGPAVFHDVAKGSNSVPGVTGYAAGAGYDLATGLGSVDAGLLVNNWAAAAAPSFEVSVSPASVSVAQGGSAAVAVKVSATGGFGSPVALSAAGLPSGVTAAWSAAALPSGAGTATLTVTAAESAAAGSYTLSVGAAGGGLTRSSPVALAIRAGCTYSIDPGAASIGPEASTHTVEVTTGGSCAWSASSTTAWLAVGSGAAGRGNGTVSWSATPNPSTWPRSAALTIAGRSFTVVQAGTAFTLSTASVSAPAAASSGMLTVTAASATAEWRAASNASWITVTSGGSGKGTGNVGYSVAANNGGERTGTVTIAGLTFTVTQAGAACTFSLSASGVSVAAGGGTFSVPVTGGAGCSWSATSSASWITVTSGASGKGNGSAGYSVSPNGGGERTGTVTVAGLTYTVKQAGAACTFSLSAPSGSVAAAGGTFNLLVATGAGCSWTAASSAGWITVKSAPSGTGSGSVSYAVGANGGAGRTGTLTIAGRTITVTQSGASCTYAVAAPTIAPNATGFSMKLTVETQAGCSWSAASSAAWIAVKSGPGATGGGTAVFQVATNTTRTTRSGTLTVAGYAFTITQR